MHRVRIGSNAALRPSERGCAICERHLPDNAKIVNFLPLETFHAYLSSADFSKSTFSKKNLSGIPCEFQTDWIQISPGDTVKLCLFVKVISNECIAL